MSAATRAARITSLVSNLDWASLTHRLIKYVFVCIRKSSKALAEDIAQDAITQVLDPHYKEWDPDKDPDFFKHLAGVAYGILSSRRQKHSVRREVTTAHEVLAEISPAADGNLEESVATQEAANAFGDKLGARFAGDELVQKLAALTADGVTTPREQAAATGAPIEEVRNARKRLERGAGDVARELGLWQEISDAA